MNYGTLPFRHTEADGQPRTKAKKSGGKGSVALLKETVQVGCLSQDCPLKNFILQEVGKLGIKSRSQVLQDHDESRKNSGEERVHRRESCKNVYLRSEIHWLQNSRKERKTKP